MRIATIPDYQSILELDDKDFIILSDTYFFTILLCDVCKIIISEICEVVEFNNNM